MVVMLMRSCHDMVFAGFGCDTSAHLWSFLQAFGVKSNAARLYVYLMAHAKRATDLGEVETDWVEDWAKDESLDLDLSQVFVVQVSNRALADEIFGGARNEASVRLALKRLESLGLISLIRRGYPRHGSLYLWCAFEFSDEHKKAGKYTPSKAHKSKSKAHKSKSKAHSQGAMTCGNVSTFIYSPDQPNSRSETGGKTVVCPRCGSDDLAEGFPSGYECRSCDGVFGVGDAA